MRQGTDNSFGNLRIVLNAVVAFMLLVTSSFAQAPLHYFHRANLPPGTVGQGQLQRFLPLRGYNQPVEVDVPKGARVAVNTGGTFSEPQASRLLAGMQVGHVYQLQVSNIPYYEGFEIYPTIEIINRLYPPQGKALRFPVPIQFTQEELELALSGRFVTRVVYLEDQASALPQREDPETQRYFEAGPRQDPLRVADNLGRPMLIMRMGSRVPGPDGFVDGSARMAPSAVIFPEQAATPVVPGGVTNAIERPGYNVPRVRVPRIGYPPQTPFIAPTAQ
ncbi:MAG: hypothetical protein CMJ64_01925 [Planctomycetaceae bacterium]|nr:hypothetical protein [Planctomycetaceae bacterium]